MSNLTSNTTELQSILDAVNALPDAGGGSSVLDNLFEVIETFTPAEDVLDHNFHFPKLGTYVLVSDPIGSPELAVSMNAEVLELAATRKTNDTTVETSNSTFGRTFTASGGMDYWQVIVNHVSDDIFNVAPMYGRRPMKPGLTYYLLRCKW